MPARACRRGRGRPSTAISAICTSLRVRRTHCAFVMRIAARRPVHSGPRAGTCTRPCGSRRRWRGRTGCGRATTVPRHLAAAGEMAVIHVERAQRLGILAERPMQQHRHRVERVRGLGAERRGAYASFLSCAILAEASSLPSTCGSNRSAACGSPLKIDVRIPRAPARGEPARRPPAGRRPDDRRAPRGRDADAGPAARRRCGRGARRRARCSRSRPARRCRPAAVAARERRRSRRARRRSTTRDLP